ncbi:MAG: glycerol-3-phosphate 1-O-acyltransferase PlsY [Flavobacteriales bacterium]|jgi:acyl phosphate:glycerol-3-phosphate acyltransferase|nr:glycerol-3-phosphate 1-O-acyltransferase PlsY [Flavobacteriales bacterium]
MISTELILFLLLAYLTGAFPSAVWVGKTFYKKDVREYGSGNAGATNTFRVLGKGAGIPVLMMDVLKGWISVNYIYFITDGCNPFSETVTSSQFEIQLALGIAAVIGHLFPIYTGFRGGKGIATLLGLLIGLNYIAAIVSIVVFAIVFLISKYVSLGSILASIAFPFVVFIILDDKDVNSSLEIFSVFVPILTLITHQKNIERLVRGEENKVKFGKNK